MINRNHLSRKIIFLLISIILIIFCSGCPKQHPVSGQIYPERAEHQPPRHRGLWIRAVSIASPDSINRIMKIVRKLNITDIYVQVVVAGYAYYNSEILPRSQYLSKTSGTEYDPLNSLLKICKKGKIRVHTWVNALLVWSLKEPPDSTRHIFYTAPEWFIKDINGRSMVTYSYQDRCDAGLEGLYLDPALPEVRNHLTKVCAELCSNYPIDGIHLDFIRYPGTLWGLPENDTAAIFAGPGGRELQWMNLSRYPRLSLVMRWMVWHLWKYNREREKNIFRIVEQINKTIKNSALKKTCILTAAVFPNPSLARYRFCQNWQKWKKTIEYPIVMTYLNNITDFTRLFDFVISNCEKAIFGIGFLWRGFEPIAFRQVQEVNKNDAAGVCFFDFTALDTMVDFDRFNDIPFNDSSEYRTTDTAVIKNVFTDSLIVERILAQITDKDIPPEDSIRGFNDYLFSLSTAPENDLKKLGLNSRNFYEHIKKDVILFKILDSIVFPLGDTLVEPPTKELCYAFYDDASMDTAMTDEELIKKAEMTEKITVYPGALEPLAYAAFQNPTKDRRVLKVLGGVYVYKLIKEYEGSGKVPLDEVAPELRPLYKSYTALRKARTYLDRIVR
ncbi:MAG TPA: hypothetical protein ENI34_02695 [candidate division WOR-3 bacterium]|uniref:Glycosyl hydrolase-like 10 domain-containing protein n=1 Tax=candidate division WOR-3 bacterium TaxID=2052148 RepID=A0A9C9EL11_UNCW3|nr:hypothetical protein [candidate division WOR-3 bacterium]